MPPKASCPFGFNPSRLRSVCGNPDALGRVALFEHGLELPTHPRQQPVGLVRVIAGAGQRQRMHFHGLAQLGQPVDGRTSQVALQRTHVDMDGQAGKRFLAQAARLSNGSY